MSNLYLDLSFIKPKKNDPPFSPVAQIELKSCGEQDGKIIIGEKCVTYEELDQHIQWLERELSRIREKAKIKFSQPK